MAQHLARNEHDAPRIAVAAAAAPDRAEPLDPLVAALSRAVDRTGTAQPPGPRPDIAR